MDTTYLDSIVELSKKADAIAMSFNKCNKCMHATYKEHEAATLDKFMSNMHVLAGYASGLEYKDIYTDIKLDFYKSYSGNPKIAVKFDEDGQFLILPHGIGYDACIYASKFADCGELHTATWAYCSWSDFVDGWSWYDKESKRFIALHADEIIESVYNQICDRYKVEAERRLNAARKRSEQLINDIERLEN